MDTLQETALREDLKSLFRQAYDTQKWQQVLIEFFGARDMNIQPRELTSEHNDRIVGRELGRLSLPHFEVGLYEFEIRKDYRIAFNRVGLRSLVKSYTTYEVDAALVVYYQGDRWRLSYICDLDESKTAPKRFTYLFGDANESYRTPVERFLFLQQRGVTPDSLRDAFSVEALTTDFFNGYKAQFDKFCKHIGGEEKWQRDYVKKLLGRLVFLQFLQKKGWMGVPAASKKWEGGDPNYLRTLLDRHKGNDRLLTEVLEPLFFETLNRKRPNDLADPLLGEDLRIPYLNGGLFDRDELDRRQLDFPYAYFDGLVEFFASYNFTIDENDPDDSDVGIDPEMLGHIFENLLEDNKDKGTYYTPKEIVQYMSQESLIQYLATHTDPALRPALERLVRSEEVDPVLQGRKAARQIDNLLRAVRVCDPAIGSGAFPMGVLGVIFRCRSKLYGFMNSPAAFSPSQVKREIIQNNIYGVDIEQGAVDIARLRFWLSLVVDEEQPQPLPNLDYKIMQGNSLLESFEGIDLSRLADAGHPAGELFGSADEAQTREAIEPLIRRHYSVTDHEEKERIRAEIDGIVRQHIRASLDRRQRELEAKRDHHRQRVESNRAFLDAPTTTPANRRKYEKNLKLETCNLQQVEEQLDKVAASREHIRQVDRTNQPFFLWHLYFKDVFDRGGFDIVIANPPYVSVKDIDKQILNEYQRYYPTATKQIDLYALFILRAITLANALGTIAYIIPDSINDRSNFTSVRKKLLTEMSLINVLTLNGVFNKAAVGSSVIVASKQKNIGKTKLLRTRNKETFIRQEITQIIISQNSILENDSYAFLFVNEEANRLLLRLTVNKQKIGDVCFLGRGEEIGRKSDFIINTPTSNSLNFITGSDFSRYSSVRLKAYIEEANVKKDINKLYGCKIIVRQVGSKINATLDYDKCVTPESVYTIVPHKEYADKYVLALLNSSTYNFIYQNKYKTKEIFPRILLENLKDLPIVFIEQGAQQPFIALVDRILAAKRDNPEADTTELEAQIDRMVYDLYGLSEDEIAIVEGREPQPGPESESAAQPEPETDPKMKTYDFFISHATEDKIDLVRPLAQALRKAGCKVWYDEFEMKVGDSLRQKIDHGLANSRYGIVVISPHFINKNWPTYEFNGMIAREIDGVKVVLPLWHNISKAQVMAYSPTLADKMALDTARYDIPGIVRKLKEVLEEPVAVETALNV